MRTIAVRDALREALHEEMARDDSVFAMGEDVIAHGGPYTVTQGIAEKWPDRIFETPITEAGIVGLGVGAALAGMRPVVEIMYLDFVTCAMDEVVNQAAKMRYMTGGQASVPLVIRLPCGPARLLAARHSSPGSATEAKPCPTGWTRRSRPRPRSPTRSGSRRWPDGSRNATAWTRIGCQEPDRAGGSPRRTSSARSIPAPPAPPQRRWNPERWNPGRPAIRRTT